MPLNEYRKKRTLKNTPEPAGGKATGNQLRFVVQKHAASHLHYDFRLEMKGVLKSWAVPKGPSMNPDDKRLAMLVEDHPYDYKDFEGIIPEGNYGAGTVIIWDEGFYEPVEKGQNKASEEKELLKEFFKGNLKFTLKGKKLKGDFVIVKAPQRGDNSWLLIKKQDKYAKQTDITLNNKSVVSGKTIEQMAADKKAKKWISNRASDKHPETTTKSTNIKKASPAPKDEPVIDQKKLKKIIKDLGNKEPEKMPENISPMLATLVDKPFEEPGWLYEVKWDGYRCMAYLNKGEVDLRSRNNKSFNETYYPIYEALKTWKLNAVLDGEIIVTTENGNADFAALQTWRSEADGELVYYVFDMVWLEGYNLMNRPLSERRQILKQLLPSSGNIKLSEDFETSGKDFFDLAAKLGLEGIMAKKAE